MEDKILKLVFAYQQASDLDQRLELADKIADNIGPPLKAFLLKRCPEQFDDVFSRTLEGVFKSLGRFRGKNRASLWSFCYRIAENKIKDHLRRQVRETRFVPADADEIWSVLESVQAKQEMSAGDRLDYEFLIGLLMKSKPDCYDFLYKRLALGWEYSMIAESWGLKTFTAQRRTERCLERAQELANKNP